MGLSGFCEIGIASGHIVRRVRTVNCNLEFFAVEFCGSSSVI